MTENNEILRNFGKGICYLTSDAQVSEILSVEDADSQPMKIWLDNEDNEDSLAQAPPESAGGPPPPAPTVLIEDLVYNDICKCSGKGTTVAVLDSGINVSHNAFLGRISSASRSFVDDNIENIEDLLGHGTQCAGLVCGAIFEVNGCSYKVQGAAPHAKVLVCKVTKFLPDRTYGVDYDASIDALEYILRYNERASEKDRVSVISFSWGLPKFHYCLAMKLQEVISKDIIVVCAASNNGATSQQPIAYPARLGHVLCIGSCDSGGRHSSFSPKGRELDFLAPGENLWAPTIGGNYSYAAVTGTSFATPLVAGVVCQLLEDLKKLSDHYSDPRILKYFCNVWGMRELLKSMCTMPSGHDKDDGFGILKPMEYFKKSDPEKFGILNDIVL